MDGPKIGYFGKLPAFGDFVSRRLDSSFVEPWYEWLLFSLGEYRAVAADRWPDEYLTAPLWRFFLSAGCAGDQAMSGVLMASMDRANRFFPFTVAVPIQTASAPISGLLNEAPVFEALEDCALDALEDDTELDAIDGVLFELSPPRLDAPPMTMNPTNAGIWVPSPFETTSAESIATAFIAHSQAPYSLWHTVGSETTEERFLITTGLPEPEQFSAMMGDRSPVAPSGER